MIRVGILTVSDRSARGEREDTTQRAIRETLDERLYRVEAYEVVPDEPAQIRRVLRLWADQQGLELILTNGGTGLAPRDRTPEDTREVLEKEAPGLAELMRAEGLKSTPLAALSRGVAGVRGGTLIVNLPGSPKGATEALRALLPVIPHALETLRGERYTGGKEHE
jgi:molybdenum cofactor synthesis domain-containing protein